MTTSNEKKDAIRDVMKDIRPFFWMPFLISSLLILLVVAFITDYNIRQSEKVLGEQMADKGIRAIWLFENVVMEKVQFKSAEARNDYLRRLGSEDDFAFIAVTNNEGQFLVHSNMQKIGSYINIRDNDEMIGFWGRVERLLPNKDTQGSRWGFVTINGERLFLVHRVYGENVRQGTIRFLHPEITEFLNTQNVNHIFAAIYPKALQDDIAKYRRKAFNLALWILGAASIFLWIFSLINRIINNRKNMRIAEKTIESMREEVRQLEKEVSKKEKLAAIGDLAAGVAHEIRNPLSSIKGYATYFADHFPENTSEHKAATIMIQEVERLNRVVGELMGVSRPTDISKIAIPVDGVLDSCTDILQADAKQLGIAFRVRGRGKVVSMDPDRIKQAVLNICLNAIEAIRDEQAEAGVRKDYVIELDVTEGDRSYCIAIRDNGPGIDKDVQGRIFDPYFTTKNEGTGLGLINVSKILEAHGGSIEVESEKGAGTVFRLYLPKRG